MKTSVVLLFFNRPDVLKQVFEKVREVKPPKLFLIQDGARIHKDFEQERVKECQKIVENVDWDCEVFKNYSEVNMGCGLRVSSGISWVFSQVDRAIILEDDCVPEPTFFDFCDELLEKYKDDERISYISGMNHFREWDFGDSSYGFCQGGAIWGWATWRRAWAKYDYTVSDIQNPYIEQLFKKTYWRHRIVNWKNANSLITKGIKFSSWAIQWGFVKLVQNQLVIVPKYNLISNIGVGGDSTHTSEKITRWHYIPVKPLEFPLTHPNHMLCDFRYDKLLIKKMERKGWWVKKIKNIVKGKKI